MPLFYYILHIFLIHALAIFVGFLFHQPVSWLWHGGEHSPAGYGHSLPFVYLMWFIVLLILYLPCKSYMAFKSRHREWGWLSYPEVPSIMIAPDDPVYDKNVNSLEQIKARKGRVIAIATEGRKQMASLADDMICIPKCPDFISPVLAVIPLQLFA